MRLLIVLILIVAGLGLYRGWFRFTSNTSVDKPTVTVTVDKDKIQQDKNEAEKKVQDLKQK